MTDRDYDVVVVGAGGAGLAAAVTAAAVGASVLVAEAGASVGGSTALAGGSFMAAGTRVQAEAGHDGDSVEEFYDYYLALNQWDVDPAVVRRFCERATPTLEWLTDLGVAFTPEGLYRAQLERFPRSHRPKGAGLAIVEALHHACRDAGVDIALGQRVDGLCARDGRVTGVRAGDDVVTAGAVVLTTGGFGSNRELVHEHLPHVARAGDWLWSPAVATCLGDGLRFGLAAGAGVTGADHGEVLLTPGFARDLEPFLPGWLVFVNEQGRRFVNEAAPYAALSHRVTEQGGRCWAILDEPMRQSATASAANAQFGSGTWTADAIAGRVAEGRIPTAATLADLADRLGLPSQMLESTIARYNRDVACGDSRFGKPSVSMKPVGTGPFYGVEMRAAVVALTGFGLRVDADTHVLADVDDEPVPGLYAAGEVTGSLLGPLYLGGGNAVGNAIVFGRIAGQTAAADAGARASPVLSPAYR